MSIQFETFGVKTDARQCALGYVRVSSEEQADRKASIEEQKRRIYSKFEVEMGIRIIDWYVDAQSGFKDHENRERFWEMIERAKADERVGYIVIEHESRWFRDRYRAPAIKGELLDYGVRVLTCSRTIDPRTVAGLWQESIEETMAHAESLNNRHNTLRGMAGNVRLRDPETGWAFKNGGPPPFGWRLKRIDMGRDNKGRPIGRTIWELDPEAAEIRRGILLRRMAGASLIELRNWLNSSKTPSPRGGAWSHSTVVGICREDMVWTAAGYTVWNKHYRKGHRPKGVKFKPTEEWVVEPNAHPAIITEEEARSIIAVNKQRKLRYSRGFRKDESTRRLLIGANAEGDPLFVCGACRGRMTGYTGTRMRTKYICSTKRNKGKMLCDAPTIDAEQLESALLELLTQRFTEEFVREVFHAANELIRSEAPLADAVIDGRTKRVKRIETELDRIKRSILAGADPALWAEEMNRLAQEKREIEEDLTRNPPQEKPAAVSEIPEDQIDCVVERLVLGLKSPEIKERRRAVSALVRQVVLVPKRKAVYVELHPDPFDEALPTMYRVKLVPPTGRVLITAR